MVKSKRLLRPVSRPFLLHFTLRIPDFLERLLPRADFSLRPDAFPARSREPLLPRLLPAAEVHAPWPAEPGTEGCAHRRRPGAFLTVLRCALPHTTPSSQLHEIHTPPPSFPSGDGWRQLQEDRDSVIPPGTTTEAGPSAPGSHWSSLTPKLSLQSLGMSALWDWSTTAPPSCGHPLPWHLLDASDPPGPPCLSSLISSLSKDSRGFASCLLARPKPFWNRQLPARHHLSTPCAPSSACQTCHFLMKPTPVPSPEFLLSAGGPTVHPPVTQGENCTCQP